MLAHIFLLCKTREIVPVSPTVVTGTWAGAARAGRAGAAGRIPRSRPPAYRTPPKLDYTCTPSDSPLRDLRPLALRSTVRSVRATGRYRDRTVPLPSSGHTTQIHTLVACATRGRRAHMVAHTSKRGLLAHRIDGLEPDIELSSGLIFGDWDNMNILQGGCRYQGR